MAVTPTSAISGTMPAQMPEIGSRVGEYEVVRRIGAGGMGQVFEGRHPIIGKRVAIKTLLPRLSSDEALTKRFVSEARAVNAIRHRGIVDIFSFGKLPDGTEYFVMELLEGQPFDQLVDQRGPLPPAEVLEWLDQVVDALGAAHAAGVIHRDLKPSNIFLVDGGHGRPYVKLLDFGIAKTDAIKGRQTPQTRASMILGTPDFMAPEQICGEPVGAVTDFYALGCVLHHWLTGVPPYAGHNPMGSMFAHLERPVRRPSERNPTVPRELDDLAVWLMAKEPRDRPQSAAELHARLDALWPALTGTTGPQRTAVSGSSGGRTDTSPAVADATVKVTAAMARELPATVEARLPRGPPTVDLRRPARPEPEVEAPKPRRGVVAGAVVAALVAGAAALLALRGPPPAPEPPKVVVAPPEPEPAPRPGPGPVLAAPPAEVAAAVTVTEPKPAAPPPKRAGVTRQMLNARVKKLEALLAEKEAAAGGKLSMMRQLLADVRAQAAAAGDDAARQRAWTQAQELEAQLDQ